MRHPAIVGGAAAALLLVGCDPVTADPSPEPTTAPAVSPSATPTPTVEPEPGDGGSGEPTRFPSEQITRPVEPPASMVLIGRP